MEHAVQKAYFEWARLHPVARWAFAVPNGGGRSKVEAGRLKAEGVLAGVSDVLLLHPVGQYHGMLLEFKFATGRPTPEQRAFLERHLALGYACAVAWDAERAMKWTVRYLRGEVPADQIYLLK